ncbi:MAG TPA: Arm DNA-binding domain-containing protein, partial [Bacteroidia bacterium]|nr:Arm DNA-binding domain-containing protein [Bacteroidia bacterium]
MKRIIMRVLFFISTKRINKKGLAPIYCRITVNGRRCEISTGIFIIPVQWSNERQGLLETSKENTLYNTTLVKIKNDLSNLYCELIYKEKSVSAEILKELYTGTNKIDYTFLELIEQYIEHKRQSITEH